jgi:hypothetical protein
MHCHLNRIIDQGSGDLESCSSTLASKLCFANCNDRAQQEHHCGSVGYALPATDAPVHGVSRRSPSPLPSLEAFPVLWKVRSGPDPITRDPPPPPATNVRTLDLAIVREVLPVNQAHN